MLLHLSCYIYLCWTTLHRIPCRAGPNATPMLLIFWNSGMTFFIQSRATAPGTTAVWRQRVHDPPGRWPRGTWCHAGWRLGGVVAAHMVLCLFCYISLCWTTLHRMPCRAGPNATPMLPIFLKLWCNAFPTEPRHCSGHHRRLAPRGPRSPGTGHGVPGAMLTGAWAGW